MAGVIHIIEGRMAERVVKALSLIENGLNICRICVELKFCSLKKVHRLGGGC